MEATGFSETGMYPSVWWDAGLEAPPPLVPQLEIKKQYFVDRMTSVVLCDFTLLPKSATEIGLSLVHWNLKKNEILEKF